jgi:transcriptional regulator with XRE-family HTH domain
MTKESLRNLIGENVRLERTARHLSIEELAEVLDFTTGFIGLIERGKRGATAYTLYRLAQVFDISIDALFMPGEEKNLSVSEDINDNASALRKKVSSLIVNLTEKELVFIINVIKGIKNMNHELT